VPSASLVQPTENDPKALFFSAGGTLVTFDFRFGGLDAVQLADEDVCIEECPQCRAVATHHVADRHA
jgi:hypothetical protein